jgi:hypothetical protein
MNKRKNIIKSFKEENREDINRYHELIKLQKKEKLEQEEKDRLDREKNKLENPYPQHK